MYMNILVYGSRGWIGQQFIEVLNMFGYNDLKLLVYSYYESITLFYQTNIRNKHKCNKSNDAENKIKTLYNIFKHTCIKTFCDDFKNLFQNRICF